MIDPDDFDPDDLPAPPPPWTPFDQLVWARGVAQERQWREEEEARRAERRAWLTENHGWPPQ